MTDFCSFTTTDWINFECSNCGMRIRATEVQTTMPMFPCKSIYLKNDKSTEDYIDQILAQFSENPTLADKDTIKHRLSVCEGCEFFQDDTCTKCGCAMIRNKNFVGKILKTDASCPENKW
jgi:hypothetical protein